MYELPGGEFERDAPEATDLKKRGQVFLLQQLHVRLEVSDRRQGWQNINEVLNLGRSAHERVQARIRAQAKYGTAILDLFRRHYRQGYV